MVKISGKQTKPSPGFEPGLGEPQSPVLTRLHELGYYTTTKLFSGKYNKYKSRYKIFSKNYSILI